MTTEFDNVAKEYTNTDKPMDVKDKMKSIPRLVEANWRKLSMVVILVQALVIIAQWGSIDACEQHLKDAFISSRSVGELLGFGPPAK